MSRSSRWSRQVNSPIFCGLKCILDFFCINASKDFLLNVAQWQIIKPFISHPTYVYYASILGSICVHKTIISQCRCCKAHMRYIICRKKQCRMGMRYNYHRSETSLWTVQCNQNPPILNQEYKVYLQAYLRNWELTWGGTDLAAKMPCALASKEEA